MFYLEYESFIKFSSISFIQRYVTTTNVLECPNLMCQQQKKCFNHQFITGLHN